jgi:PPP family 3-phenylpropionic acid transporter
VRFSVFYWALFLQIGVALPFWPMVLAARGLTPAQIGFISAAAPAARMIAGPLVGLAFDRYRLGRGAIFGLSALSAIGLTGFGIVQGFWQILVLTLLVSPLYHSIPPLVDAHAIRQGELHGLDFGRMRLWGSLGFVFANLCAGALIAGADAAAILGLVVGATVLCGLAAPILPPLNETPGEGHGGRPDWGMAGALLRRPAFLIVVLVAGGIQATHALLYGLGSLGWRAQGLSELAIGLLWAVGVLAEVALLSQTKALLRRFGAEGLLVLGGAACVLRWTVMAFEPPLPVLFALQLLHAFTFAATYVGGIHLVQETTPRNLIATGQALFAALSSGVLFAAATAVSGVLFGAFGSGAYVAPALLAGLLSAAAYALFRQRSSGAVALSPRAQGPAEP